MGLGSRILNLFSPGKGNTNDNNRTTTTTTTTAPIDNNDNNGSDEKDLPINGDHINFMEEEGDDSFQNTSAAITSTTATANTSSATKSSSATTATTSSTNKNGDTINQSSHKSTSTPPPSSTTSTKSSSSSPKTTTTSSTKKKGHCNYPGCTRALFARGKCYKHDTEMKRQRQQRQEQSEKQSGGSELDCDSTMSVQNDNGGGMFNGGTSKMMNGNRSGNDGITKSKRNGETSSSSSSSTGKKRDSQKPTTTTAPTGMKSPSTTTSTSGGSTSPRKNRYCTHPGCTRALFARGKCYKHDNEVNNSVEKNKKMVSTTTRRGGGDNDGGDGDTTPRNSSSNNSKNSSSSNDRKSKGNEGTQTTTTTPTTTSSVKKPTKTSSSSSSSSSSSKKKSSASKLNHCNYPGCTRALFARGKCYKHDTEVQRQTKQRDSEVQKQEEQGSEVQQRQEQRSEDKSSSPPATASSDSHTPSNSNSNSSSSVAKKKEKKKSSSVVKSTPKSASTTKKNVKKSSSTPSSSGSKHCSYPGCTRALFARGMCYRHDTEAKKKRSSSGGNGTTTPSPPPTKAIKSKRKKASSSSSSTKEQQPSSSGKKRKKKGHCNYPGCTRALFARGKCYKHDHETKQRGDTTTTTATTKKRTSSSSAKTNTKAAAKQKSNSKSAVPILPSLTKALTSSSSSSTSQRKSAIARRPRQLKPTEKLLAMQEDALALYDGEKIGGSSSNRSKKKRSSEKLSSTTPSSSGGPPKKKKVRVGRGSSSEGGVGMEEFTSNTNDEEEEESNYDDVVCCLCKCGVDFSDADFFLPEQQSDLDGAGGKVKKGNLKTEGLDDDDYSMEESNGGKAKRGKLKKEGDAVDSSDDETNDDKSSEDGDSSDNDDDDDEKPPFQLPHRFHNPRNGLILCDGPAHAGKRRGSSSNGQQEQYRCDRAYHQRCHFIPVFAVPRGPWRCLICRYRDAEYLRKKGKGNAAMNGSDYGRMFTDEELNVMFRCSIPQPKDETEVVGEKKAVITNVPPAIMSPSNADIASLEHEFENVTGQLKAKIMKEDLTTKAEKVINAALSNIRNSEHSLRSFTETSRSRKALAERIQCIGGLPQELTQCVMRIAQNKLRIKDLIVVLEESIRCAPHHVNTTSKDSIGCIDAVSELMAWYLSQTSPEEAAQFNPDEMQNGKTLLQHLFPEGDLHRRRFEPRTGEAHVDAEDASVKSDSSGVSLDDLKCSCCHGGMATDDNDMLLCDGIGCYRAFHMQCLEPKMTLEEVEAAGEDEAWFCPLCTAHANLVHYAQREYLLDDWEHDWDEIMKRRGHSEWEMADDVFPEAELELRVAKKFKDGIKDDETTLFIAETFGIGGGAAATESDTVDEDVLPEDDEDEEDDEDFDVDDPVDDGGSDGDSSAAEDMHEEKKLLKEKIGRDELDALSICSSSEESDSDASSDEDDGLRRSKRKRFTFRPFAAAAKDGDSSGNDSKSKDMGALDVSNIVRGKRSRSKVDYRKLADTMFGDDSDEEARGSVMKYDYKPKRAPVDESTDEDESSSDEGEESESDDEDDSQSGDE